MRKNENNGSITIIITIIVSLRIIRFFLWIMLNAWIYLTEEVGKLLLREKCQNTKFFLVRILSPEKTPYLDIFHTVFNSVINKTLIRKASCFFFVIVQRCSIKKMFLETSQNSQENICVRISFSKLWHTCFPVNFVKFSRTPFCIEHLWWLLLVISTVILRGSFRRSRTWINWESFVLKAI